ncbi:MAG: NYN domain-containing protein [Vicinamibacterales bacterium]
MFIDFDNIEIGVKTTLNSYFDVGAVLEALKERGEVVTKIAYGDWTRAGDYSRTLTQHAIHMVQRNLTPGGDKNGADIHLALDALEMAFTHSHINAFVIVGGDSDFMALVEKLKQYDKKVFVVGGRAFTSVVLQKNCHEFIAYENLTGRRSGASRGGRTTTDGQLAQAVPLVKRALKVLVDREVTPQLGVLKSTLLQLDSAFSEREYGASSFRDFIQKLANAGYVALKGTDRSLHVWWKEGEQPSGAGADEGAPPTAAAPPVASPASTPTAPSAAPSESARATSSDEAPEPAAGDVDGTAIAEGVRVMKHALLNAAPPRWPLYVRQMKQLFKTYDTDFDERRFGFAGLVDAVRHMQKLGFLRLERDRVGVLRVFPGPELTRLRAAQPAAPGPEPRDFDDAPAPSADTDTSTRPSPESGEAQLDGEPLALDAQPGDAESAPDAEDSRGNVAPAPHGGGARRGRKEAGRGAAKKSAAPKPRTAAKARPRKSRGGPKKEQTES